MIDWYSVIANSFWIVGLSLLLAAFSYYHWLAQVNQRPLRQQLSDGSFGRLFWISLFLVSIGLVATSNQTWEMGLWGLFALYCLLTIVHDIRQVTAGS